MKSGGLVPVLHPVWGTGNRDYVSTHHMKIGELRAQIDGEDRHPIKNSKAHDENLAVSRKLGSSG